MTPVDGAELTGRLLVATPVLLDPNFARTVVVVCQHDSDGALGFVLNRMTDIDAGDYLPLWSRRISAPDKVFVGGPVDAMVAVGLGAGAVGEDWVEFAPGLGLVNLDGDPDQDGLADLRIFSGYAGWGAGQLEAEVAEGAWFTVDARREDLFSAYPDSLYYRVLRRQPGREKMFAVFPEDPELN